MEDNNLDNNFIEFENEEDYKKFREQMKKEIKEEVLKEMSNNMTLHNKKIATTKYVRDKYVKKIVDKFGPTGAIDSAIRTVATYKMGSRKCSLLNVEQIGQWEEILDFLYRYVLGETDD